MHTPVALIVFNRPDLTARVFAEVARARPPKLLLIADGPRAGRPDDLAKCAATRAIVERVDWDCEVVKAYSEVNLGCGRREASGMIWIFEQVEEAIILEDDTLPNPSFFPFCEALLEQYRDDERVMHISGDKWIATPNPGPASYTFSRYCLSWGWAGWRRAFRHYDPAMKLWPTVRDTSWLLDLLGDERAVEHWKKIFDLTHAGIDNVDTWDYQWLFTIWLHHGLAILPGENLISNLGFNRADAAHLTGGEGDSRNQAPTREMSFPLSHPAGMVRDRDADQLMFDQNILPRRQRRLYDTVRNGCVGLLPVPLRQSLSALKARRFAAGGKHTGDRQG
ncbi:MAG: glycosyltransferase family 2 protein [Acidobacteriota bacterium]